MKKGKIVCCLLAALSLFVGGCALEGNPPTDNGECVHSFGEWRQLEINAYGAQAAFSVAPEREPNEAEEVNGRYSNAAMDNIVKLLSSESFAEQMLLNGEVLPEKGVWVDTSNPDEVSLNLNALIDEATAKRTAWKEKKAELENLIESREDNAKLLVEKREELENAWAELYSMGSVQSSTFSEYAYRASNIGSAVEGDFTYATKQAYEAWSALRDTVNQQGDDIGSLEENTYSKQEEAEEAVKTALDAWRNTAKYKKGLKKYGEAVFFSYLREEEADSDLVGGVIYANVIVVDDQAFAAEVFDMVKKALPDYVEKKMIVPMGYAGTACKRVDGADEITKVGVYERGCALCGDKERDIR